MRYVIGGFILIWALSACNLVIDSGASGLDAPAPTKTLAGDTSNTEPLATRAAPSGDANTTPTPNSSGNAQATTAPDTTCTKPGNWVEYTIQRGDTLGRIADLTSSSTDELTTANCLDNPNRIRVGQVILVPKTPSLPTSPAPTATPR